MAFNKNEKLAYEKGYRYTDGVLTYNNNQVKQYSEPSGYLHFSFVIGSRADNTRKELKCKVHRLVAYQKYGDDLYNYACVRHLDNNKENNSYDNIVVGSMKDNIYDNPAENRLKYALNATKYNRIFSDDEVAMIRKDYSVLRSYKKIQQKYNISSSGTLWYILNANYQTKV